MKDFDLKSLLGGLEAEKPVYKSAKEKYTDAELALLMRRKLAAVLEAESVDPAVLSAVTNSYDVLYHCLEV